MKMTNVNCANPRIFYTQVISRAFMRTIRSRDWRDDDVVCDVETEGGSAILLSGHTRHVISAAWRTKATALSYTRPVAYRTTR